MALLISESSDSDADDFTVGMTVRVTDENVRQVNASSAIRVALRI